LLGENYRNLTQNPGDDFSPDWSPDGKKITFYSTRDRKDEKDENTEIYIMNRKGKNQKRLTENEYTDIMPDFSPKGDRLAFSSDRNTKKIFDIFIMNSDGSKEYNVTNSDDVIEKSPDWIDEETILFERTYVIEGGLTITEEEIEKLSKKDIDTKKLEELINLELSEEEIRTMLTGMKYKKDEIDLIMSHTLQTYKKTGHIFTVKTDGTGLRQITDSPCKDCTPACSPDKTKIAFSRQDGSGYLNIYVADIDGKNVKQITGNEMYHNECPSWSPEGQRIVFSSWREKSRNIYIIYTDGTNEYNLLSPCPKDDTLPAWSPF